MFMKNDVQNNLLYHKLRGNTKMNLFKKNEIETKQTHLIVFSWIEMSHLHWFKYGMRLPDLYFSVRVVGWYLEIWPMLRLSISTFYLHSV